MRAAVVADSSAPVRRRHRGRIPILSWAILQLREGLDPTLSVHELELQIRMQWPNGIFRFPAIKQGRLDAENPLSAYVFARPPVPPRATHSPLIASVLQDPVSRAPYLVTEDDLAAMAQPPAFPPPGTPVLITAGDFTGLEGTVVEVNCTAVKVLVELWSKQTVLLLAANEIRRT